MTGKKRLHIFFLISSTAPSLSTIILMGIFLLPHGVGYRFSIGHIDAPRFILLATIAYWFVVALRGFFKSKTIIFTPGSRLIGTLITLILVSAITSSNPVSSTILAGQLCLLWFVFAYAYSTLSNHDTDGKQLAKTLTTIFVILFIFALYEVVFQTYLIPHKYRTSFWGIAGYEWITSRILYRSDTILAQGPFMWNHALSGLCVAGSGIAIYAMEKHKNWGLIFFYGFVMLLIAAGTRAGFYAVAIAFLLYSIWFKQFFVMLHFALASLITEASYIALIGSHAPVFFAADMSSGWVYAVSSMNSVQKNFNLAFSSPELTLFLSDLGTVGVKIMGFLLNVTKIEEWWLFGYGFGAFQRPGQISSNAIYYDDPGIIQLIFLESGVVAGCLLIFILIRATLLALKYEGLKLYSVGITAWSLFALSSWEVWPLMLVMIFVFKIFKHDQLHRNLIVETHHSPH